MTIEIKTVENQVFVTTPYHPKFPPAARRLGGRWLAQKKVWSFDLRDEERVRELCYDIYGTDGSKTDLVDVRIVVGEDDWKAYNGGLYFAGRKIASAYGRDSGALLGEGVVLLSGSIKSGGSRKYWTSLATAGSIFEVRDVPRRAVPETHDSLSIEIIS